jgi:hypothetical protein
MAMAGSAWREVPVGPDAHRWVTRTSCKSVLIAVHTVISGQRLLEITRLIESDPRIQVVFSIAPDVFNDGVADFLHDLSAPVIPWDQAIRLKFDLAVVAAYGAIHQLHAPLIVVPHGAGYGKLALRAETGAAAGGAALVRRSVYGLDPQRIIRDGRVVPTVIILSHDDDLAQLARQCPEAVPAAVVAGDPCFDRLMASRPERDAYRRALKADRTRKVILVASTWGPHSLFGRNAGLLSRVIRELPAEDFRVVSHLHYGVWAGHGPFQVRAWLADCMRGGMALIPPGADWRGALVAADLVIGDHGSVAVYGTAVTAPVVLAGSPGGEVDPASAAGLLAATAPRLNAGQPLLGQLVRAMTDYDPGSYERVAARITSEPGRFGRNMRQLMYRLLRLSLPAAIPVTPPAELPFFIR